MSFPTDDRSDLFSNPAAALIAWTLGEAWTVTMRATSTCDVDIPFGMAGGGGFLMVMPAHANGELRA